MIKFLLVFLLLINISCTKNKTYLNEKTRVITVNRLSMDANIPTKVWKEIEDIYKAECLAVQKKPRSDGLLPIEYFGYKIFLIEKTSGVLGSENLELIYGRGGGSLNLKEFVRNDIKGAFYFAFKEDLERKEQKLHVIFIPNTKKRKVGKESVGSGCGTFLNLTEFFNKRMDADGIVTYTSDVRYLNSLVGTFVFLIYKDENLYVSHLVVEDSRHRELECRRGN